MASSNYSQGSIPLNDPVIDGQGIISRAWLQFLTYFKNAVEPLGIEKTFDLVNNQAVAANIEGLSFSSKSVSQGIVEYLIQRVTTSTGALEIIENGTLQANYLPSSDTWSLFEYLKVSNWTIFSLVNSQAVAADITGLLVNLNKTRIATVEYLIERVTTGGGATELIEGGSFSLVYKPTSAIWTIVAIGTPGPSAGGITFTITAAGQVQYTSTNITGTASISRIGFRVKQVDNRAGIAFSITSTGQIQYTSSNMTGTAFISKISWRARTIEAKHYSYSSAGPVR